jgi:hypothetical protein
MYLRMVIQSASLGIWRGGAVLDPGTFLTGCELKFLRREQNGGRETLVFTYTPRPEVRFSDDQKYVAQLNGLIWIDAQDRILTRVAGWPVGAGATIDESDSPTANQRPPAVYFEMVRLPGGDWLPSVTRINGADYPKLFDRDSADMTFTYGEYKRFGTQVKDVELGAPGSPR